MSTSFVPAAGAVTPVNVGVVAVVVSSYVEPVASVPETVSRAASLAGTEVV
ncbi:hypothetical protein [Streptomyces capitiformicae]|uniref:Uncharacterized protein n=1 Tax=Streptomyces capitiformicae TaxID=2014920 RepID=A0A918ZMN2_9ACTN|nr:hypothetical protein [Streptomyces capitiformicae]GHE58970.1 hypothetical protein GCM10017771_82040 [Streptomyces capitiformicae]